MGFLRGGICGLYASWGKEIGESLKLGISECGGGEGWEGV